MIGIDLEDSDAVRVTAQGGVAERHAGWNGRTAGALLDEAVASLRRVSETPRLDAEVIVAHDLGLTRTRLLAHPEMPVAGPTAALVAADLARRAAGEPVAYIRGTKEFHGLAYAADPRALIPRPETELLVDLALEEIAHRLGTVPPGSGGDRRSVGPGEATSPRRVRLVDVGTGSGTILLAVAVEARHRGIERGLSFLGTDISAPALALAAENADRLGVAGLVELRESDLLPLDVSGIDLLLANLPYIPSAVVPTLPVAASFEPRLALDGGEDGLEVVRRLLGLLPSALAPDGIALLEIGADQRDAIAANVAEALPGWGCSITTDLAGRPRVARLSRA